MHARFVKLGTIRLHWRLVLKPVFAKVPPRTIARYSSTAKNVRRRLREIISTYVLISTSEIVSTYVLSALALSCKRMFQIRTEQALVDVATTGG